MKKVLFVVLVVFGISTAQAQFSTDDGFYINGSIQLGNYLGVDLGLNYTYQEKYSVKLGYMAFTSRAESIPDDYSMGLTGIFSFGLTDPHQQMEVFHLSVGRIILLNSKGTIRLNLSAGLAYTIIEEPRNFQKVQGGFIENNYTWNYARYGTVSLIINPRIEFPFTRIYGLTISPMVVLNKDYTYFGVGIGQMLGILWSENK